MKRKKILRRKKLLRKLRKGKIRYGGYVVITDIMLKE